MKRIALLVILFTTFSLKAQHEQDFWIFGHRNQDASETPEGTPAMIDFNPSTGLTPAFGTLNTSANPNPPNNITIADDINLGFEGTGVATHPQTGELLFYTDGNYVYNGSHVNVTPTSGTLGGNNSNGQPVALCIDPGDCSQNTFYIFSNETGQLVQNGKITYRKYNSDTESFSIQQNLPTIPADNDISPNTTEGTLIIPSNTNPNLFWLIAHTSNSDEIRVYEINSTGISSPQIYHLGPNHTQITSSIGNMAYTVNGDQGKGKIALINNGYITNKVFTLDIDLSTGVIDNPTIVINNAGTNINELDYDVEFSPNGSKLYITTLHSGLGGAIYQYDFSTSTIDEIITHQRMGGVKLGPDNNIYYLYTLPNQDGIYGGTEDMYGSGIGRISTPDLLSTNNSFVIDDDWEIHLGILGINFPEFITMPDFDEITLSSSKDTICTPESFSISVDIGNLTPALIDNYDIYLNGDLIATTNLFPQTFNQPGEYHVILNLTNGCLKSAPLNIVSNCCSASTDPLFQTITSNINNDTYWDNKIYIPDNTVITVDGAILDITTTDVVFGECAGINFINGATLRANNSVFRPCSIDGTWKGIYFDGSQESEFDNQINESTFKNAEIALYFEDGSDGLISNNLFSNCNQGVRVESNKNYNHTISGNRFVTEEFYPIYNNCYTFTNLTTYGIYSNNVNFSNQISQNEFIKTSSIYSNTVGIEQKESGGLITNNTFTGLKNAINLISPKLNSSINSNTIEINSSSVLGIFVDRSSRAKIEINDNILSNHISYNVTGKAILIRNSKYISIASNKIEGFSMGVFAQNCEHTQISENEITNARRVGIRFHNALLLNGKNFITCNTIKMYNFNGRGILVRNFNRQSQISSNCIFDSRTALHLIGSFNSNLPAVRNNYFYNYTSIGINVQGYTGNIGTNIDPGMNTLWSNNSSATDIQSTNDINIANNFGVFNFSFQTVHFTSNNTKHSTTSCANQIFDYSSQDNLNTKYKCDNSQIIFNNLQVNSVTQLLLPTFKENLEKSNHQFEDANLILGVISNPDDNLLNDILSSISLTDNELARLKYNFYYKKNNYLEAKSHLEMFIPNSEIQEDYKNLRLLNLKSITDGWDSYTADEKFKLLNVTQKENTHSNYAISLLNNTSIYRAYQIPDSNMEESIQSNDARSIKDINEYLTIYPSPSSKLINIDLINVDPNDIINLYDVTGKLVTEYNIIYSTGKVTLNIENINSGLYFVSIIESKTKTVRKGKFTKIK